MSITLATIDNNGRGNRLLNDLASSGRLATLLPDCDLRQLLTEDAADEMFATLTKTVADLSGPTILALDLDLGCTAMMRDISSKECKHLLEAPAKVDSYVWYDWEQLGPPHYDGLLIGLRAVENLKASPLLIFVQTSIGKIPNVTRLLTAFSKWSVGGRSDDNLKTDNADSGKNLSDVRNADECEALLKDAYTKYKSCFGGRGFQEWRQFIEGIDNKHGPS